MINHSPIILSSDVVNALIAEEKKIKNENNVEGHIEVDRVLPTKLEILFDGYYKNSKRYFRLLGEFNLITKKVFLS